MLHRFRVEPGMTGNHCSALCGLGLYNATERLYRQNTDAIDCITVQRI